MLFNYLPVISIRGGLIAFPVLTDSTTLPDSLIILRRGLMVT